MKKRDLFLAGALLLGMSVQAQEQLFFYGFEADETSLLGPDSLKIPVDSVKQLQYYKNEGTTTGAFFWRVYSGITNILLHRYCTKQA